MTAAIKRHPWITAAVGSLLAVVLFVVLYFSRQYIQQQAMRNAVESLQQIMDHADRRMHQIENAADSLLPEIEEHIDQPELMFGYSRKLLEEHPDLKGCSISFDPDFYKSQGHYFSAYSYNNGDSILTEQEGNDNYQYYCMDWFLIPRLLYHSYWIEPYAELNTSGIVVNEIMTSYCQPIQGGPDHTVGVLSVDVPLQWLKELITNYHPMPKSYCMLLGVGGSYIVHPDSTRLLYETIFTQTLERPDTALTSLGRAMTNGETGYKNLKIDGVQSHVFYMPFHLTGWSIALVCPDTVILSGYYKLLVYLLPIILLSVMLMLMPLWRSLYRRRNYAAVLLTLLVLSATSCQQKKPAPQQQEKQPRASAMDPTTEKVTLALEEFDGDAWLQGLDSLEKEGEIPACQADYLRGQKYEEMEQQRSALIFYKKATDTDKLLHLNKVQYYQAFKSMSTIYLNSSNVDMAFETITKGYQVVSKDTTIVGRDNTNLFLLDIGLCQLRLHHFDEAAKTFDQARQGAEQLAMAYPKSSVCQQSCIQIASNIANYYMNLDMFDKVEPWINMMEQALQRYGSNNVPMENYATFLAMLTCNKAIMWSKTGHPDEGEAAYQSFLATGYAKTLRGVYDQAYYLQTTEQWDKLLAIALRIDSVEAASGMPPTLDYVIESPSTIFTAMLKTGQKDLALQKAEQIVNMLDSVQEYQRRSDANELAVIYETEQKDQQIADQRSTLNRQRMQGVVLVVVLLVIFLGVLFEMYRKLRRAHTLLEASYANLMVANAKAEESSKMKTNFIRQISHEIRTPLNILSGFTQIITMPDMKLDDATRTDINQKIVENTDRITGLVNKMLELSDANSMAVIERKDLVPAVQIMAQAIDASEIAHTPHVKFDMQAGDAEGSYMLHTNEDVATRALTMLLDNARKFTRAAETTGEEPTAQERVTLSLALTDTHVKFTVEDTGKGVPAEEAEHIFDEFVQLDEYYEGTGIGLTVARSLARRLGGDVVLDTSYQQGARFVMALPLT